MRWESMNDKAGGAEWGGEGGYAAHWGHWLYMGQSLAERRLTHLLAEREVKPTFLSET